MPPWASFRQNACNSPRCVAAVPATQSARSVRVGGIVWGTAVIDAEDNVYVGSTNRRFFSIAPDGRIRWVYKLSPRADSLVDSAAALHPRGYVVIPGGDGMLHAVCMSSGRLLWAKDNAADVPADVHESGVIVNSYEGNVQIDDAGRIYAGCDNGFMYCLDADGTVLWKHRTDMMVWTCAAVHGRAVYFGSLDHHLYCVRDGTLAYKKPLGAEVKASPLVHRGRVYAATANGDVFCIGKKGDERWKARAKGSVYASPVVAEGCLIVACLTGHVHAWGLDAGAPRWTTWLCSTICSSPIVVGGVLLVATRMGKLVALSARGGRVLAVRQVTRSKRSSINASLALDGRGNVVVGGYDGHVHYVPWNFHDARQATPSMRALCGIDPSRDSYVRVAATGGHIITLELVVPSQPCAAIARARVRADVPFEQHVSADGKFINLVPRGWAHLGRTFTLTVTGTFYCQSSSWLRDRFELRTQPFRDTVTFRCAGAVRESPSVPLRAYIAGMYLHQPVVLETYIPAALDAQGFIADVTADAAVLTAALPDEQDDFIMLHKQDKIRLKCEMRGNYARLSGSFHFSAMGGTVQSHTFVAFVTFHVAQRRLSGQFFGTASCLNIKGNGRAFSFSSGIVNKLCDKWMRLQFVGEFRGRYHPLRT